MSFIQPPIKKTVYHIGGPILPIEHPMIMALFFYQTTPISTFHSFMSYACFHVWVLLPNSLQNQRYLLQQVPLLAKHHFDTTSRSTNISTLTACSHTKIKQSSPCYSYFTCTHIIGVVVTSFFFEVNQQSKKGFTKQ